MPLPAFGKKENTMKSTAAFLAVFAALVLALLAPRTAQAQVTLALSPPSQTGSVGSTVFFSGQITNSSLTNTVFLNGDSLTFNAPAAGLTLDDTPFLTNAPPRLGPVISGMNTFTGGLFNIVITPSAAPGTYFGTFAVLGGSDATASGTLASANFSVTVAAAPEPSPLVSLGVLMALSAGSLLRARRHKSVGC